MIPVSILIVSDSPFDSFQEAGSKSSFLINFKFINFYELCFEFLTLYSSSL